MPALPNTTKLYDVGRLKHLRQSSHGIYYRVVNLTKSEVLDSPYAAQLPEWNKSHLSAHVVLWALWTRWNGDTLAVYDDCGGPLDFHKNCWGWPNVWGEIEADYVLRHGSVAPSETKAQANEMARGVTRRYELERLRRDGLLGPPALPTATPILLETVKKTAKKGPLREKAEIAALARGQTVTEFVREAVREKLAAIGYLP